MKFENASIWKKASRLSAAIFKCLHDCRDSNFKSQITVTSLSISSTLAEGIEHQNPMEATRAFKNTKASCFSLLSLIYIGMEIGLIPKEIGFIWKSELEQLIEQLNGQIESGTSAQ